MLYYTIICLLNFPQKDFEKIILQINLLISDSTFKTLRFHKCSFKFLNEIWSSLLLSHLQHMYVCVCVIYICVCYISYMIIVYELYFCMGKFPKFQCKEHNTYSFLRFGHDRKFVREYFVVLLLVTIRNVCYSCHASHII